MAKKPLRPPVLTQPGARRDFFVRIQELVLRSGDASVAALAQRTGYSHQAVYLALTGPRVPSRRITEAITTALGKPDDEVLSLWVEAVGEQRDVEVMRQTFADLDQPAPTAPLHGAARPRLTPREQEAFTTWLRSDTNEAALEQLGIRRATLHSYLRSVRVKYAAIGRPAPTKTTLLVRALQDEILSLSDFD